MITHPITTVLFNSKDLNGFNIMEDFTEIFFSFLDRKISVEMKTNLLFLIPQLIEIVKSKFETLIQNFILFSFNNLQTDLEISSFHIFCLNLFAHEICIIKKVFRLITKTYLFEIFKIISKNKNSNFKKKRQEIVFKFLDLLWEQKGENQNNFQLTETNFEYVWNFILDTVFERSNLIGLAFS